MRGSCLSQGYRSQSERKRETGVWTRLLRCWIQFVRYYVTRTSLLSFDLRGAFNRFPDFFVQAFKIVVDSRKFSTLLLLYILWVDLPIFMILGSNEQLHQELEYTLLDPDYHSWVFSKMQSGREGTLEELYAIKFCFKLGKNAKEKYGILQTALDHPGWIEHQFLSCIRDSRKAGSLWGMLRGMKGVRKSIHQSWLAWGLGLGLLCWGFKGVQGEIPSSGQHSSNRVSGISTRTMHQCTTPSLSHTIWPRWASRQFTPSLLSRPCSLWLLVIP